MASKAPIDSNLTPMVKIKLEPETSTAPILKNIKIEPGVQASTTRLPSFRVPRDLTLGANKKPEKPKKIYTPNINAQRNKKKEDGDSVKKEIKPGRGRGRGRGQGDRGRGRGKTPSNLIQSTGVFSEGITESSRTSRRSAGYRDNEDSKEKSFMEKPLLHLNQTIDKADEEEKIKSLLRDDFIDDGSDPVVENAPISLPLFEESELYKNEAKKEMTMEVTKEEEEIDVKPILLPNGEAVMPPKSAKGKIKYDINQPERKMHDTIMQIFENQPEDFILIQFPDCLPGLRSSDESTDHRSRKQSEQNPSPVTDNVGKSEFCTLESLKAGLFGKIQISKSGKARLLVGDNSMVIDVGSKPTFRQDLVTTKINADNISGELVNLGRVNNTVICSPDWETMLASL